MEHLVACGVTTWWDLALLPAADPRHREVVDGVWTVFAGGEHVPHTCLVHIKSAQLRYLAFVLLPLVELNMLLGTLYVPLESLSLLRLR